MKDGLGCLGESQRIRDAVAVLMPQKLNEGLITICGGVEGMWGLKAIST